MLIPKSLKPHNTLSTNNQTKMKFVDFQVCNIIAVTATTRQCDINFLI